MNTQVHLAHLTTSPNVDARLPPLIGVCFYDPRLGVRSVSVSNTPNKGLLITGQQDWPWRLL
jgi:hypothetical protein